jgi:hypothetical protein
VSRVNEDDVSGGEGEGDDKVSKSKKQQAEKKTMMSVAAATAILLTSVVWLVALNFIIQQLQIDAVNFVISHHIAIKTDESFALHCNRASKLIVTKRVI